MPLGRSTVRPTVVTVRLSRGELKELDDRVKRSGAKDRAHYLRAMLCDPCQCVYYDGRCMFCLRIAP